MVSVIALALMFTPLTPAMALGASDPVIPPIILPDGSSAFYFPIRQDVPANQPDLQDPQLVASGFGQPPDQFATPGDDRENYDPTTWAVYEHQTTTDVVNTATNNNYRVVDLFVETTANPNLFTAVYVANSGSHAKSWWFLAGSTPTDLLNFAVGNNARIVVQKAFPDPNPGGSVLFYTILISNTGADAKTWWFWKDQTVAQVTTLWQNNNARLVQVNSYVRNSTKYYDVVMISNTGADTRSWWWYVDATPAQLATFSNNNNARVVDLDYDAATGNYNAIMTSCANGCPAWWWYFGVSTGDLISTVLANGARILDVNVRPGCGDQCWDILLIDNSTTTIAGNAGLAGVSLNYSNGGPQAAISDANGYYSFSVHTGWSGIVTPVKTGYIFPPGPKSYSNVFSNQTSENYTALQIQNLVVKSAPVQDGWVLESGENTNLGGSMDSGSTTLRLGDDAARKQYRSVLSFDTSSLPDNAVITKVTLKLRRSGITGGGNPVSIFHGFLADVRNGIFGFSALQPSDWQTTANKTVGPFNTAISSGWYILDLTAAKAQINKLASGGGLTQIRLRFKLDDNNDAIANFLSLYSGNAGAAARPQLIVEYYIP